MHNPAMLAMSACSMLGSLHMISEFVRRNLIADLSGVIYWLRSVCVVSDGWACLNGGERLNRIQSIRLAHCRAALCLLNNMQRDPFS